MRQLRGLKGMELRHAVAMNCCEQLRALDPTMARETIRELMAEFEMFSAAGKHPPSTQDPRASQQEALLGGEDDIPY